MDAEVKLLIYNGVFFGHGEKSRRCCSSSSKGYPSKAVKGCVNSNATRRNPQQKVQQRQRAWPQVKVSAQAYIDFDYVHIVTYNEFSTRGKVIYAVTITAV